MRTVVAGTRAVGVAVEGVLRRGHFALRLRVEYLRRSVYECAPGVMRARAEVFAQPFVQADLHRMIDRLSAIAAQPFGAARIVNTQGQIGKGWCWAEQEVRVCTAGAARDDRIAVHTLEE